MPRQARQASQSGIYHVMLRGINQQYIFEENEDCEKFLEILGEYKELCGYELYAYCLMGNHVHLLLKSEKEDISSVFRRIGSKYVYWYNRKYHRQGHLFQDRYRSEPVETDAQFLECLRYIHRNPVSAGISAIGDYAFSSYNAYLKKNAGIVDTDFALSMMSRRKFIDFCKLENDKKFLETSVHLPGITDEEAKKIMKKLTDCGNASEFQALEREDQNQALLKLVKQGLGIRQLVRLTGATFYTIKQLKDTLQS